MYSAVWHFSIWRIIALLAPTRGAKCCCQHVCLSLCPCVPVYMCNAWLLISKTTRLNFTIFCMCYMCPWFSLPVMTLQYMLSFILVMVPVGCLQIKMLVINFQLVTRGLAFSALALLVGRQEDHSVFKNWVMRCQVRYWSLTSLNITQMISDKWWGVGVAYPGCPGKEAVKWV